MRLMSSTIGELSLTLACFYDLGATLVFLAEASTRFVAFSLG